jgi:MFS family permease
MPNDNKTLMNKLNKNNNSVKISIYPILTVNFVGTLGFGIVLPFLVFLVTRYGGNAFIYGIMGATYSAFQLIGAPILGRWSDMYGRKRILLLSQLGTLLSWIIFLIALYLPQTQILMVDSPLVGSFTLSLPLIFLFIARLFDGLTGGNVSVANAYLADITAEDKRNENFGKMAVSANLGFIFGPALAGLLGTTSLKETLPVLAALIISVIASLLIAFLLPESKKCTLKKIPEAANVRKVFGQEHKDCYKLQSASKLSLAEALKQPTIPTILLVYFLIFLGFNFFYIAFPVHAVQVLKWKLTDTGIYFAFLGIIMALVQGPVLTKISKAVSESKLILIGSFLLAIGFSLYIFNTIFLVYIGALFIALGNGLMWPSVLSLLSQTTDEKFQGIIQGFAGSMGSVASVLGLLLGGVLYTRVSGWIFLLSAIIISFVFIISLFFKYQSEKKLSI